MDRLLRLHQFNNQKGYGFITGEDGKKQTTAVDYRGKKVPFVPAHTMSLTADYRIPVSANGLLKNIIPGINLVCNGPTYWDVANEYKQDLYAVLGAHLTFDFGCSTSTSGAATSPTPATIHSW